MFRDIPGGGGVALRVGVTPYRGNSLIRNHRILAPYSRPMSRALRWSWGGGTLSYERGTHVTLHHESQPSISNPPSPIPNPKSPIPHPKFPIPNSQSLISNPQHQSQPPKPQLRPQTPAVGLLGEGAPQTLKLRPRTVIPGF